MATAAALSSNALVLEKLTGIDPGKGGRGGGGGGWGG